MSEQTHHSRRSSNIPKESPLQSISGQATTLTTSPKTHLAQYLLKLQQWWKSLTIKKKLLLSILVLTVISLGLAYRVFVVTANNIIEKDNPTPLLEQIGIILGDDKPLQGEAEDRINVLLLGIGGEDHEGGELTDSIMIASIVPSTKEVALLSLPRDLIVKVYDDANPQLWEGRKINNAYSLGGMDLAVDKVEEVTGLPLHYYVLIDFKGFTKVIDDVDGVAVNVERSFTGFYGAKELSLPCPDAQLYQLDDGAYCAIDFERGLETMDGERALIYARVRKIAPGSLNPEEGSDFARAQRQQKILESFKDKVLSSETLLHPSRIGTLLESLGDHLETNMEIWEIAKFAELSKEINTDEIISRVVDDSPQGLVYSKIYAPTGASVVVPNAGEYNFSEIHKFAENIFEHPTTVEETAQVQVLNGTVRNGLAAQMAESLQTYGIEITDIGNAPLQNELTTSIYDLTEGSKPTSLESLQKITNGTVATEKDTQQILEDYPAYIDQSADFIIIVGEDALEQTQL